MRKITERFALIVGFLITLTLLVGGLNIGGIALFKWLLLVLCILCVVSTKQIRLMKLDRSFFVLIICVMLSIIGAISVDYIQVSFIIGNFINVLLIAITVKMMESVSDLVMMSFVKGIKLSCYFQSIYCVFQYLFRKMMGYSLNRFIFADIFHIDDEAALRDMISDGIYLEHGMNSHPSVLIPIIIIMMCFSKNRIVSTMLGIIVVVLSRNSTAAIAFVICLLFPWFIQIIRDLFEKRKSRYNGKKFIKVCFGIITGIGILFATGWHIKLFEVISRAWVRLLGNISASDYSTRTHALYYTSIPIILRRIQIFNILFGHGFNSSGDVVRHIGGIQNNARNWAVESDPVDLLYGIGIVGLVVFYYWFIKGIRRACNWNNNYIVFAMAMLFCGITYRIQYLWVIMFELTLFKLISNGIDVMSDNMALSKAVSNQKKLILYK